MCISGIASWFAWCPYGRIAGREQRLSADAIRLYPVLSGDVRILGISAFYHDSAAALLVDGKIVAAAQEERFTRRKHDPNFPAAAIRYCLSAADVSASELDHVVFYEKPFLKFERLLETYLAFAPRGFQSFRKAIPVWLK